jgi:hypothetical protein
MAKRLQVILRDSEHHEIDRILSDDAGFDGLRGITRLK